MMWIIVLSCVLVAVIVAVSSYQRGFKAGHDAAAKDISDVQLSVQRAGHA